MQNPHLIIVLLTQVQSKTFCCMKTMQVNKQLAGEFPFELVRSLLGLLVTFSSFVLKWDL